MVYLPRLFVFFFYYNIIYLIFLLTKQNPGTTDQRRNRRGASGGFDWGRGSTLAGTGVRVHPCGAALSPRCTPTGLSRSPRARAATTPAAGSRSICDREGQREGRVRNHGVGERQPPPTRGTRDLQPVNSAN